MYSSRYVVDELVHVLKYPITFFWGHHRILSCQSSKSSQTCFVRCAIWQSSRKDVKLIGQNFCKGSILEAVLHAAVRLYLNGIHQPVEDISGRPSGHCPRISNGAMTRYLRLDSYIGNVHERVQLAHKMSMSCKHSRAFEFFHLPRKFSDSIYTAPHPSFFFSPFQPSWSIKKKTSCDIFPRLYALVSFSDLLILLGSSTKHSSKSNKSCALKHTKESYERKEKENLKTELSFVVLSECRRLKINRVSSIAILWSYIG